MNELEEFWEFVAEERKKAEQQEEAMEGWSVGHILAELSRMEHNAVVLKNDFEKIGNARAAAYWQGYGDAVEEVENLVVKLRSVAALLEQAISRLEDVQNRAVVRKQVDIEIDVAWSIEEIKEACRRLRA